MCFKGETGLIDKPVTEREGHYNDDRKPEGFDTKQVFVSPSIKYSGHPAYAKPFSLVKTFLCKLGQYHT